MYEQGIAVYESELQAKTYNFKLVAHDFAVVYLDDRMVATYDRSQQS